VRPLSCARSSTGNVPKFLLDVEAVVPWVQIGLSIALYKRSLFFVESFDLRPSNQYILVRVITSCFFKNVIVPGESPVKVQSEILDFFFLGVLHIVYKNRGARLFSCCDRNMDGLASVSFHSPFLKPVLDCNRLVCSFCEAVVIIYRGVQKNVLSL
jgi:hypothetical protein